MANVRAFETRRASGWPLTMHVVPLEGSELLVHSPSWLGDDTIARVEEVGKPRVLFAPNHYHHLHLARFREAWPNAIAIASEGALPRLRAKGHSDLRALADAELPASMHWLVPEGTKSGEAWLSIEGDGGPTWIVCDAFFHENRPVSGFEGVMLRLAKIAPGLAIGATFTLLCIADRARYRDWVLDAVRRERPARVLFSHGEPLIDDAPAKLEAILRARLGG